MPAPLFPLGRMLITPRALEACLSFPIPPTVLLVRHATGDWSDCDREDQARNLAALLDGSRVFSVYKLGEHRFYVITEADRSVTTILLPDEY